MHPAKEIKARLDPVLQKYPEVQAAFLFGSQAEGRATAESDIDLALVGPRERLAHHKLDLLTDLTRAGLDNVDIIILDGADTALRFEAVRPNCLVYATPEFDRGSYYSRVLREYFDFEPYLRMQRQALRERLTRGQA